MASGHPVEALEGGQWATTREKNPRRLRWSGEVPAVGALDEGQWATTKGNQPPSSPLVRWLPLVKRGGRWAGSDKRGPEGAARRKASPMGIADSA